MDSGSSQHDPQRETRQRKGSAPLKAGEGAGADPIAGSAPSASETIHVGVIVPSERVVLGWLSQIYETISRFCNFFRKKIGGGSIIPFGRGNKTYELFEPYVHSVSSGKRAAAAVGCLSRRPRRTGTNRSVKGACARRRSSRRAVRSAAAPPR